MIYTALADCTLIVDGVRRFYHAGDTIEGDVTDSSIAIDDGLIQLN